MIVVSEKLYFYVKHWSEDVFWYLFEFYELRFVSGNERCACMYRKG